jgi:hypothetical protein
MVCKCHTVTFRPEICVKMSIFKVDVHSDHLEAKCSWVRVSQGKNVTVDVSSGSKCHSRQNVGRRKVKASPLSPLACLQRMRRYPRKNNKGRLHIGRTLSHMLSRITHFGGKGSPSLRGDNLQYVHSTFTPKHTSKSRLHVIYMYVYCNLILKCMTYILLAY